MHGGRTLWLDSRRATYGLAAAPNLARMCVACVGEPFAYAIDLLIPSQARSPHTRRAAERAGYGDRHATQGKRGNDDDVTSLSQARGGGGGWNVSALAGVTLNKSGGAAHPSGKLLLEAPMYE